MSNLKEKLIFEKSTLNFQILNGIADLIRVIDASNNVVFVNRSMEKLLGGNENFMYCSLDNLENSLCNTEITQRSLRTGEIIQREEKFNGKYYSVKCSPILDSNRNIIGVVEVFRNITLEKYLQLQITEKNKSMTMEMKHARAIQQNLLPEKGFVGNLKLDFFYKPKERLSGDIFDVFEIDENNIGMYISDSVGHGFAASMMTMFIRQTTINISKKKLINPALTLMEISNRFQELGLEVSDYFTMFYAVYNRSEDKIKFSNAGHNCPPIFFNNSEIVKPEVPGLPISLLSQDYKYENKTIDFHCSDKLLLYTDGILESKNYDGEEFGIERLIDFLINNEIDYIKTLDKEIERFNWADQADDMSALLIEAY